MNRYLILFAREPRRESREKGFGALGEDLFAMFATGWLDAARRANATLVVASPPEDRRAWDRLFSAHSDVLWVTQRGVSFGERLEQVARCAAQLPGNAVVVGGDVAPEAAALTQAFEALEWGAEAVIGPAADGGVSLVALKASDVDLLAAFAPRQRDVSATLQHHLHRRGRSIVLVGCAPDVDGRRGLTLLLRRALLASEVASLIHRVLCVRAATARPPAFWLRPSRLAQPRALRAPPVFA